VGEPKPEVLVNVTLSLTQPDAARREFAGLLEAKQKHGPARAVVVTQETGSAVPPPGIEVVPAWRFLLEGASGA
jgi:predicted AAA+ superfamily ATPase